MSKAFQQGWVLFFFLTAEVEDCKPDLTKIQTKVFPMVREVIGKTETGLI